LAGACLFIAGISNFLITDAKAISYQADNVA